MSFLLNIFNDSNKSEEFSLKDIEVLVDSEKQNWFKRAHIGRYLRIARIITSTSKLSEEDKRSRAILQAEGKGGRSVAWTPQGKMPKIIFLSRLPMPFMSL